MHHTHIAGVDLNLLPGLVALLEERHVSRAAARVGLSQPAMSRALQRLRRTFDDALLVSSRDGYTLTPRAERLRARLAGVLPELDALFGPEHFDPLTAQESYRLALSDYSVALFGGTLARAIRGQSPGSTLAYSLIDDAAVDDLSAGTIDLLILGRPVRAPYSQHLLFQDRFACAVAADHPLAGRQQLALQEYLSCPHIRIDIGRGGMHLIEDALPIRRNIVITTPFHAFTPEMLPGTDLVLTFPARLAPKFTHGPDISIIKAPTELPALPFYSVWHPRLDNDPSHRWLRAVTQTVAAAPA
ncbi:LysR family transcriptional regulator [Mycobacterium sp. 21AC1]|uniref:LysR family transcriptional regulator n=1 Tax=[Mycobacterium] appelbergii TaxID=2939269 RepID=UPI002938D243|nr:LysR family transcriptional regulator [Mycobacterium sp. 21AC1]MDV3125001.1 LysR family transcriptional regulator [Mycobacterium sp. 21AC1]